MQPSAPKSAEFSYEPPPPYPGVVDGKHQQGAPPPPPQFNSNPPPPNFQPHNGNFIPVQQQTRVVFVAGGRHCPACHVSE